MFRFLKLISLNVISKIMEGVLDYSLLDISDLIRDLVMHYIVWLCRCQTINNFLRWWIFFPCFLILVPRYVAGESEAEASKEGRNLRDFKYACVGYSVYPDRKGHPDNVQETQKDLPMCVGLEVSIFFFFTSLYFCLFFCSHSIS